MHRLLLGLLLAVSLAAFAQDDDSAPAEETDTEVSEASEDDADLDEQGYAEQNEDDFEASDRVAADQSLAFPTDI